MLLPGHQPQILWKQHCAGLGSAGEDRSIANAHRGGSVIQWRRWVFPVRLATRMARDLAAETVFRAKHQPARFPQPDSKTPTVTVDAVSRAIGHGAAFIHHSQHTDGSFRGWFLPQPGAAISWPTAHAALVLDDVPELESVCHAAAMYLHAAGLQHQGWGYNDLVRNDLDTTAQALIVLHRHGLSPPLLALWMVVQAQAPSGGFPTFAPSAPGQTPRNSSELPHADVTLLVVHMLQRLGVQADARERALAWLATQEATGTLPAFWWSSPVYSLWAQTFAGLATEMTWRIAHALLDHLSTQPYLAMVLRAALGYKHLDGASAAATSRLLGQQRLPGHHQALCMPGVPRRR
ncbi:MAG: hypothetical protein CL878_03930 [Dehalococcoidia bacterium]|nr:hypothetical protein [Dehalococcoidia bacterium]